MSTEDVVKVLKDLPLKVQTSSLASRKEVFTDVQAILPNPALTEPVVRGICKVIQLAVSRYRDSVSQKFLVNIVSSLSEIHPDWTIKHLTPVISNLASANSSIIATKSTAQECIHVLAWSCSLVMNAYSKANGEYKKEFQDVCESQAILFSCIFAAAHPKKIAKAYNILQSLWKYNPEIIIPLYKETIFVIPESLHIIVFGATFLKHVFETKKLEHVATLKPHLLDKFVKIVVGSKTKVSTYVVDACHPMLVLVDHNEFSGVILPAIQKAMLRNPELILQVLPNLLSNLSLDLSQYADAITKSVAGSLCSNDEESRKKATGAMKSLSLQCSDSNAVSCTADHLFKLLGGSQGKITVADHKIAILQALGNLSFNSIAGSSIQLISTKIVEQFIKVLETEVHEKTLLHCVEMLGMWCAKFTKEIPEQLLKWIDSCQTLKQFTPHVRAAYFSALVDCCNFLTAPQLQKHVPSLLKVVEKAAAQPLQMGLVREALAATCLLLKMASTHAFEMDLSSVHSIILDMDKQLFLSDKFLSQSSPEALCQVVWLCEVILMEHASNLSGSTDPIYRALVLSMINGRSTKSKIHAILQRLFSSLQGTSIAVALLDQITEMLIKNKLQWSGPQKENGEAVDVSGCIEVKPRELVEAITTICSGSNLSKEDRQLLALHSVLACYHPFVESAQAKLWLKLLKFFKFEPAALIKSCSSKFVDLLVQNFKCHPSYELALRTVVSLNPDVMLPPLLEIVVQVFNDSELLNVTQQEYAIYLSPAGQLFDKSIISNKDSDALANVKNMKRESKIYSFKEQQEEILLRKELEEKKRKEGKIIEPELTPKQKELVKLQMEKEAAVREKLQKASARLECAVKIVESVAKGAPLALALQLPTLIPPLVRGLSSPLSAPNLAVLYVTLNETAFISVTSGSPTVVQRVSHTSLRLLKPKCDLNSAWENQDLNSSMRKAIADVDELGKELTAPALTYLLPMIEVASLGVPPTDPLLPVCIRILSTQAKLRKSNGHLHNPSLLPRCQLITLLINIIGMTGGRVQQQAVSCLQDLAMASNGIGEAAVATHSEIGRLLFALQDSSPQVRDAAQRALFALLPVLPKNGTSPDMEFQIVKRLWVAKFDIVTENQEIANKMWEQGKFDANVSGLCEGLLEDVTHPIVDIQQAAAHGLASLLPQTDKCSVPTILTLLLEIYMEKNNMIPAKVDSLGRIVEKPIDTWEPRSGVALALTQLAPLLSPPQVTDLAKFYVEKGLGDRNDVVRNNMLAAALAAVDQHGKETVSQLLPIFEPVLDKGPDCSSYDAVRQSVVILMGSLARHLDKDDPKVKPIVTKLIDALSTPSQQVQEAVASCLPALVPSIREEAPTLVQKLLDRLLSSESYGQRKGAAYGLAGIVKGMGILVLKQLDIMTTLTEAIQDKKNYRHREGALFAFEMLCSVLGRLFEPYIVHVLPHLLLCFGDGNQYVRDATDDCAKVVMSKLSAHGVKLVLPSLLAALEKDSWRTKTGSVELLGAMAYCAPKQLSSCLPSIVPKLIEVLSDSHVKVQNAGTEALKQIGSVIRNPEIQAIVPVLLEALQDPANKTATCLQTLLDTQFVHFIDAPSLALIMPVVQRAFQDRSTETRKMAAQIIGNMYSLTDQKDLTPYLPTIIPGLKTSLLDPVPEVRSVSARALGAMVRGMGEASFEDLLPWLMKTLTSENSSVDRSGAAQGLSEVVGGLGVEKLHKLMPEIIATAERPDISPHVKDGYIMMFIYMPVVFTNEFTPYIGEIITPILKALADENEYVRDTALKAGQRIVNLYADSAITLLLPELENGLFDDNWRIRYSSVQLLGDLLYRISGVSGKMSTETANEDDNFGTEQSHRAIIGALGAERRNRVLAGLYMGRSDVALMVRQAALHVWKVVVTNTPRTLREILPTLFSLLLGCLASTSHDKRQVAAKTLGDLVRKLGERVLPEIIPILENGLESDQPDQRQGVCIGLSEMMASTSRDMVLTFVNSLVPTVRKALCDPLPEVRQAAAKTFDSLHATVGVRALDDILPQMLQQLNNTEEESAEWALDGLRQVMSIKSRVVLPYLIPQLTSTPVNTKALSILASVAGEALTKYLVKILPALMLALASSDNNPQELEYCQAVILSVTDETGVCTIIDQLLEATKSENVGTRRAATTLLCAFTTHTRADYTQHVPQLIRGLILTFVDKDPMVLQMAWDALSSVTKSLDPTQQTLYVGDVRQAIKFASSDLKNGETLLPGLCLPKGITPILPLFRESILNGAPEVKEAAAHALGEAIQLTTDTSLQPSVIHITGPLIRILGDRFAPSVKAAVLQTLAILLAKVGLMLKQFLPQLQTTFLKALNDSNRLVRLKAAMALSHMMQIHNRPDPLFQELHQSVKTAEEPPVRETMLQALRGVITAAGDKISPPVLKTVYTSLTSLLNHPEEGTRCGGGGCVGAILRWIPPEVLTSAFNDILQDDTTIDWTLRHGRSTAVFVGLKEAPERVYAPENRERVHQVILNYLQADRVPIALNGVRACGYLFDYLLQKEESTLQPLLSSFVRAMNHTWAETKQLVARVCIFLARQEIKSPEFLKAVIPMLVNGTKEKNSYVKSNSELALVAVLRLRHGQGKLEKCLALLDEGAREALNDVITKVLNKVASSVVIDGKLDDLDDTLLT